MSKFIEITDGQDGKIIWIENSGGEACGICHDQTVIDEDGLPEQDWDNEQTFINLKDSNGEDCKLVFSGSSIEIVND